MIKEGSQSIFDQQLNINNSTIKYKQFYILQVALFSRNYLKKTSTTPLTQELYNQACSLMKAGQSIRAAARAIGFSDTALRKRMKCGKGGSSLGRFRKVLTREQEQAIEQHCVELDKRFFGLSLKSLRYLLYSYAEKNNISHPFPHSSKMAGRDFTREFMKRNKLSLRTPRKTSVARTMGFNRGQLSLYFDNLEATLKKYNIPPQRIYNMDETGVQTVPNKLPRHVAPTGKKEVAKSVSAEQGKTVTVVCAISCVGHYTPPFFIYARKRENRLLIKGGPTGCDMAVTDKGYMNVATFVKWLTHFKKYANPTPENPILLILDNHVSHISLPAVNFAKANDIHLLTLPPHSSHRTQPLDRCFFRPFKAYYDAAADSWITSRPGQTLSEYDIAELVKIAFEKAATVELAVQSFRSTGIHPFDRNIFTDADFLPAEVTEQNPDEAEPQDPDDRRVIIFGQNNDDPAPMSGENDSSQADEPTQTNEGDDPTSISNQRREDPPSNGNNESPPFNQAIIPEVPLVSTSSEMVPFERPSTSRGLMLSPGTSATPSFQDAEPTIGASPGDIIPLPRITIRRKRTGRGLKSCLVTSTPNKKRLEDEEKEKERVTISKKVRATRALFPVAKRRKAKCASSSRGQLPQTCSSSDSESDSYSLHNSSSDFEKLFSSSENDEDEPNDHLQVNRFVVVKVKGKTKNSMRLYVSKILRVLQEGYDVLFYKRVPGTQRFVETTEEAFVDSEDIFMALSKPVVNSSGRFKDTISFSNDLCGLTIY